MRFHDIPQLTRAGYTINVGWDYLPEWLDHQKDLLGEDGLSPDFQRAYVWTQDQKSAYIEWCLRGGTSGRDIYWCCGGWMNDFKGPMVLVDGQQRVKSVLEFMDNKVTIFDGLKYADFTGHFPISNGFIFHIADFTDRKTVLQWYIDLNCGSTVHKPSEIQKVKQLLLKEINT